MSRQKTVKARKQALADSFGKATQHHHSGEDRNPVTDTLDIWTGALVKKATTGRGSNGKISAHGIQKLRELILELAVRGRLVPQDPDDEPASVLLERIADEKERLIGEKAIRKTKMPAPYDESHGHHLPQSWSWATLYDLGEIGARNNLDDDLEVAFVPMQCISEKYGIPIQYELRKWKDIKSGFTHFQDNDVVLAKITPCFQNGKSAVMHGLKNRFGAGTTELHVFRSIPGAVNPEYVLIYLKSPGFIFEGIPKMTGTAGQKRITRDYFAGKHFPLPPIEEQHRIVAKVDELIALCDRLEQQQADSIEAHQTLVETLLGALTRAENEKAFSETWQRIADHFDILFTTEHSIDQLKQTILQLAVMGKLIPQDLNNEPAVELMKNLSSDRDIWLEDNKAKNKECSTMLRKLKKLKSAKDPFSIPETWITAHLIQLCQMLVDCHNKTAPYVESGVPIIRTSNIRERKFRMLDVKYVDGDTYNYWSRRCPPEPGDIIFTREAPMGEAAIIPDGQVYCLGQRTMLIRPMHEFILTDYLLLALTEPHLLERASEHAIGSTVKHLRVGDVENLNIPVPPLAEQHRIVAKFDELMALCDNLKAHIENTQTTQTQLADAIVEQAVA